MAMSREEILNRLSTINGVLKRDLTRREREQTLARKAELEEELKLLMQEEQNRKPVDEEQVQSSIAKIRETFKKERKRA